MAAVVTESPGFFDLLARSELLPADRVERLRERLGGDSPTRAAGRLVAEKVLTRYQAERLLGGRYRGFFIDHYRLLAVLGAGGMGLLYVAEDGETGRRVALKVLGERHREDNGMIARLRYEAKAGGRVVHPNVVHAEGFTKSDDGFDQYYLVMDFVEAVSAEELLLRTGHLSWGRACDVALQAARGLQAIHDAHLIHRDVKPANLLVSRDGSVKIADFGLAMLTDDPAGEFSLQMIFGHDCLGSADYMAPEQSRDSAAVGPAADLYGLGCTLYSLLTARVPFPGQTAKEAIRGQRELPPPDVRDKAPGTPDEVAEVVLRLMRKEPERRFASAAETAAALAPFAKRKPVAFDFDQILATRSKHADKRNAAYRRSRTRAGRNTTVTMGMLETSAPNKRADASGVGPGSRTGGSSAVGGTSSSMLADSLLGAATGRSGVIVTPPSADAAPAPAAESEVTPTPAPAPPSGYGGGLSMPAGSGPVNVTSTPPPARLLPEPGTPGGPLELTRGRMTLGRNAACDLNPALQGISGRHCEFVFTDDGWRVRDLGSRNGTAVHSVPVGGTVPLRTGDVVTLAGGHHYRFEAGAEAAGWNTGTLLAAAVAAAGTVGGLLWWWLV